MTNRRPRAPRPGEGSLADLLIVLGGPLDSVRLTGTLSRMAGRLDR